MKLHHTTLLISLAGLTATLAVSQSGQTKIPEIKDKAGNMWVRGYSRMRIENLGSGKYKFTVSTSDGKKLKATWAKENIDIESGGLECLVVLDKTKAYRLQTATMSGGIVANFVRASANAQSKENQTANIRAASAEYNGSNDTVTVKGNVTLTRSDPGAGQSMSATGASGTIQLSEQGASANAVKAATLNGPVKLTMTGVRPGDDGKPLKYNLIGLADRMVFNDAARTIVFTGNVRISGDDPTLGGDISGVNSATVKLTKDGEIESIDLEGDPGRTVVQDKRKGDGGR
jgi:lipopolysaccharide export system protein LptA